jgi:ParB-like chromosome segregation protein Spo0J
LHTELRPIAEIQPHPRNPNRHPEYQIAMLSRIILSTGWRNPIVVSALSGYVTKGHGRLQAAKHAGLTHCPVSVQEYASQSEEHADMIADNRLSELSEMDTHALAALLNTLDADMRLAAGFGDEEFQSLIGTPSETATETPDQPTVARPGKQFRFGTHNYPLTDEEFDLLDAKAEAYRLANGTSYGFVRELLKMQ